MATHTRQKHVVCRTDELPPGERKIVEVAGRSIGVFNIGGTYYALRNLCPHKGAELCRGRLTGLMLGENPQELRYERVGEVLRCPWHGWEFDVKTGKMVIQPGMRVKTYDVSVEEVSVEQFHVSVEGEAVVLHV